jgi:hypothetical protein
MLNGRCLCGKVRYEVDGTLGPVVMCHCSMCRRASGSAFATNASVDAAAFRIVAGRKSVTIYESSKDGARAFCRKCGSPVFGAVASVPQIIRIRLGLLENARGARPQAHVWTQSKAEWFEISDGLRQFDREAPGDFLMPGASNTKPAKKKRKK